MNQYQTQLFDQLMHLCNTNEAFYFKDTNLDNSIYRVYTYRLASYSDFLLPSARECRGVMFEMDITGNPVRLACLTPSKFFNDSENPMTIGIEYNSLTVDGIMDKMDGSIISTFIHNDELRLKSKTSLESDHVHAAMAFLNLPTNSEFKRALLFMTRTGRSVHMELTSPILRIVLGYPEINLTVLSIRDTADGTIITKKALFKATSSGADHQVFEQRWVPEFIPGNVEEFIKSISSMTGVEGYVVRLANGEHVKLKCDWYCALHKTKDSVSAPRRLFECIINEAVDDLKGIFSEDPITMKRITDMENKVVKKYNHMMAEINNFYEENKGLDRKSYAITAQAVDDNLMALKMCLYLNKPINFKEFAIKHPELFDINKDEVYDVVIE